MSFVSGTDKFYVVVNIEIDVEAEKERIGQELAHAEGFVASINKKLSNERFVNNAPAAVVDKEKQKLADGMARIKNLKDSLENLN